MAAYSSADTGIAGTLPPVRERRSFRVRNRGDSNTYSRMLCCGYSGIHKGLHRDCGSCWPDSASGRLLSSTCHRRQLHIRRRYTCGNDNTNCLDDHPVPCYPVHIPRLPDAESRTDEDFRQISSIAADTLSGNDCCICFHTAWRAPFSCRNRRCADNNSVCDALDDYGGRRMNESKSILI